MSVSCHSLSVSVLLFSHIPTSSHSLPFSTCPTDAPRFPLLSTSPDCRTQLHPYFKANFQMSMLYCPCGHIQRQPVSALGCPEQYFIQSTRALKPTFCRLSESPLAILYSKTTKNEKNNVLCMSKTMTL